MTSLRLFAEAPAPGEADVVPGDIFALGQHRLMCGDAAKAADVAALFGTTRATLVVTSPPYANLRDYHSSISCWDSLMLNALDIGAYGPDVQLFVNLGVIHRKGQLHLYWEKWLAEMKQRGWTHAGMYVWDKLQAVPGANIGTPRPSHEFIFHLRKKRVPINDTEKNKDAGKINWGYRFRDADGTLRVKNKNKKAIKPFRPMDSVIRIRAEKHNRTGHPAVFPVALPAKIMAAYRHDGCVTYDPFCGSGSSLLAADSNSVACMAMEISPTYVSMAVRRWNKENPSRRAKLVHR